MKFLVFLITQLIAGGWGKTLDINYNDHSLIGGWGNFFQYFAVFSTIIGGVFYYVPISRLYFRKSCHVLIDFVAFSLKSVLNSFDTESQSVDTARVTFSNNPNYREPSKISREEKRKRKQDRLKNRGKNNEENKVLSTVQLYPGRSLELRKYFKSSHNNFGESEAYMMKESRHVNPVDVKWSKSTIRRRDDGLYSDHDDTMTLTSKFDEGNSSRRRGHRRLGRDEPVPQKIEEKLRKLRRRIRSIATVPDKNFREQKETEALKIIDDLLRTSNYRIEIKRLRKNEIKNEPEVDKEVDDAASDETPRSDLKSGASSRQESPIINIIDLPKADVEGIYEGVQCAQPPLLNDRLTPLMKNALHWFFGGCPGAH